MVYIDWLLSAHNFILAYYYNYDFFIQNFIFQIWDINHISLIFRDDMEFFLKECYDKISL